MDSLQALALGVLQGLTEFLPVSSSGHLVLLQNLFGRHEPELLFDICLHMGTLAAVCLIFFTEIREIFGLLIRLPARTAEAGGIQALLSRNEQARMAFLIVAGSIPTAVLGLLFHSAADRIFGAVWIVGIMLMVTGTFLWFTRKTGPEGRSLAAMTLSDALAIGLIQGIAIIPGISRSGATISLALYLGIDRDVAGRYSFLLSIPAILGALVLQIDAGITRSIPTVSILIGTAAAAGVGWVALKLLLKMVKKGRLHRFAPYCWAVGAAVLVWSRL
jgi:undecaprenyl-diphosphatase